MSFDKHSNFNKLANFSEVKFGENMPVLEVELNEMQQIQNEARADIIRDTMPSGFVTLGEIDYDYCKNNSNQIKLKSESIAYANGYRITIPANTIIEIGESDKVREDLVFLEVWKEVVTDIDELKEYGGEDNEVINNPIKDSRYPVATTQRVALKYRIRHVGDVDFSGDTSGLSSLSYDFHSSDKGLYIKTFSESLDGFVYAIPMFRLLRKPNVGLASPFEYKKIHNQLDPKKFAHLVGQENVEKVHSVEIAGRTYNNHTLNTKDMSLQGTGSFIGLHLQHSEVSKPLKTNTDYLFIINVKSNTLVGDDNYSLDFGETDPNNSRQQSCFTSRFSLPLNALGFSTHILHTKNSFDGVYCVSRSQLSNSVKSGNIVFDYMIIEYSPELVDIDFIPYFEGVKSLGELTNNSITVENNLVKEGTYVHELQNHILPTYPEVTHVTWGEDVVIPPEVEIELKNGEEVIQTITQLPVKLETTGEEKLHVKTMKGRTLVNLSPKGSYTFSCHDDDTGKYTVNSEVNEITLTINENPNNWRYFKIPLNLDMLKPNTKYLVIFDGNFSGSFSIKEHNASYPLEKESVHNSGKNSVVIETNDLSNGIRDQFLYLYPTAPSTFPHTYKVSNIRFIEYQEGMENWGLKYFEGMKSVEAPSIRVIGKNLYTHQKAEVQGINNQDVVVYVPVSPNTTYTFDASAKSWSTVTLFNTGGSGTRLLGGVQDSKVVTFTTDSSEVLAKLSFFNGNNTNIKDVDFEKLQIQFVEGSDIQPYELGKLNELKTPKGTVLRSLPNGNSDTFTFNTGTCNNTVKELRLLNMGVSGSFSTDTHTTYILGLTDAVGGTNIYCNSFIPGSAYSTNSHERITINTAGTQLALRVSNSRLGDLSMNEYLQLNPVFVQYGLSTPLNKKIGLSEEDYVGKSKVTYQLAEPLNYIPDGYFDEIKGNKLIKRTGVITLDGSSDEQWSIDGDYKSYGQIQIPQMKKDSKLVTNLLQQVAISYSVEDNPIGVATTVSVIPTIRIRPFDHNNITLDEITSWLNASPLTVIFELANPIEIPLKEVSPLECDFSLYRQFNKEYLGYPKELPNGVKDIVVSKNKIKRYTRHLIFNGSDESWTLVSNSSSGSVVRAFTNVSNNESLRLKALSEILNSYKFPFGTASDVHEQIGVDQNGNVVLSLAKSRLSSSDLNGFKDYLRRKNLQVIVELNTPTMHDVSEGICKHIPYMPLNSYVGSLYLTNGINQTKFLTDFSPSEYEVQTYHRHFSSEFNMFEDIKRKKSPYGHKTYLEEVDGKYVEKFISGLEKHEIEDLRHKVSLTGFDYSQLLQDSFLKLIKGELS